MSTISTFFYGLMTGLSLIIAIGAQNAFVLKQGLKGHYVFIVCLICALSDALLIALGVVGFGKIIKKFPLILEIAKYMGCLFLLVYGAKSLLAAVKADNYLLPSEANDDYLPAIITACLAFTWLNPHVYLDTVILLGSIATQFKELKLYFALGAMAASCIFFFSLGYGAKLLAPIFAKPIAWRILDFIIGLIMWGLALMLITH